MENQEMTEQEEWDAEDADQEERWKSLVAIIRSAIENTGEKQSIEVSILNAIFCNAEEFHEYLWKLLV